MDDDTPATEFLGKTALLGDLSEKELEELEAAMEVKRFSKGHVFYKLDQAVKRDKAAIYFILDGEVVLNRESDKKHTVPIHRLLRSGGVFGLISFVQGGAHSVTSTVTEDSRVGLLNHKGLDRLKKENPSLAVTLQFMMARQLAIDLRKCNERLNTALNKGIAWEDLPDYKAG